MDLKVVSALKKEIQTDTDSLVLGLHLYEFSKDAFFFVSNATAASSFENKENTFTTLLRRAPWMTLWWLIINLRKLYSIIVSF